MSLWPLKRLHCCCPGCAAWRCWCLQPQPFVAEQPPRLREAVCWRLARPYWRYTGRPGGLSHPWRGYCYQRRRRQALRSPVYGRASPSYQQHHLLRGIGVQQGRSAGPLNPRCHVPLHLKQRRQQGRTERAPPLSPPRAGQARSPWHSPCWAASDPQCPGRAPGAT